ncbi:MAG: hypothetical protein PF489_06130 [Salinivirgaceae bacterium]|jgi:hypothetical protein|nr:hypothetical protein [Salinivirgaceae bacterium]
MITERGMHTFFLAKNENICNLSDIAGHEYQKEEKIYIRLFVREKNSNNYVIFILKTVLEVFLLHTTIKDAVS